MILLTIDELTNEMITAIKTKTQKRIYMLKDSNIPYEDIEIIITYGSKDVWNEINFEEMKKLKWIQIFQTGIEQVPINEIKKRNIKLTNVRNIYGAPMSEYVMSIILYEIRELDRFRTNKAQKKYDRKNLVDEAINKNVVIFGTGMIGKEVAKKAQAFDMNVLGFNSTGHQVVHFDKCYTWDKKDELIKKADFIVLLLPLLDNTYHFFREKEFKLMKEEAYLINIGRGPLIEEGALLTALNKKWIKGAALDVFYEEPLPQDSRLWDANNLILTPHISGKTKYFFGRCLKIFEINFQLYTKKETMNFEVELKKGF